MLGFCFIFQGRHRGGTIVAAWPARARIRAPTTTASSGEIACLFFCRAMSRANGSSTADAEVSMRTQAGQVSCILILLVNPTGWPRAAHRERATVWRTNVRERRTQA